jgi:hypothetical protein
MKTVVPDLTLNQDDLFDEFPCFHIVKANWKCAMKKMTKMLAHFSKENINAVNIKCLIRFCLALPGSNALIECVFSIINVLLSDEKNRLKTETVKTLAIMKIQFKDFSCSEFFPQISKEKVFLEQVHKSDKYSGESGKVFAQ